MRVGSLLDDLIRPDQRHLGWDDWRESSRSELLAVCAEKLAALVEHGLFDYAVGPQEQRLRNCQAQPEGLALGHQNSYCGGVIRPTTTAPGSTPGVGLSTTVSAWSGLIPVSARM